MRIVPHPRTLRKARLQMQCMIADGLSAQEIKTYLHRFVMWWVNTSDTWMAPELLNWLLDCCWDRKLAAYAKSLLTRYIKQSHNSSELLAQVMVKIVS